ncbi:MAG: hypothetical protein AB7L65_02115 [Hyphomonadaceae bacterium]
MSYSWQGASGRWYEFDVARAKRAWEPTGAVYMFVKPGDYPTWEAGGPVALYIAKTANLQETLARHEMWAAAQQLGVQEIHLLLIPDEAARARAEKDLLDAHTPILNRQMLRRVA